MIRPINNQPPLTGLNPRHAEPEIAPAKPKETGTAIVIAAPASAGEETLLARRWTSASYLAHLIATRHGAPQTRERRRAEPQEATAAYADALERIHRFP
jgi:hypothetical protein